MLCTLSHFPQSSPLPPHDLLLLSRHLVYITPLNRVGSQLIQKKQDESSPIPGGVRVKQIEAVVEPMQLANLVVRILFSFGIKSLVLRIFNRLLITKKVFYTVLYIPCLRFQCY